MPDAPTIYDLVLLLSTSADEARRKQILAEIESAISSGGGSIERNHNWGARGLAYRIAHESDAEYHLLQFRAPPPLLESLSHSLRIADDVVRFRIIKVIPGMPPASDSPPPVVSPVGAARTATAAAEAENTRSATPPASEAQAAQSATAEPEAQAARSATAAAEDEDGGSDTTSAEPDDAEGSHP
jgi:small subunit ribosomal protein S6